MLCLEASITHCHRLVDFAIFTIAFEPSLSIMNKSKDYNPYHSAMAIVFPL